MRNENENDSKWIDFLEKDGKQSLEDAFVQEKINVSEDLINRTLKKIKEEQEKQKQIPNKNGKILKVSAVLAACLAVFLISRKAMRNSENAEIHSPMWETMDSIPGEVKKDAEDTKTEEESHIEESSEGWKEEPEGEQRKIDSSQNNQELEDNKESFDQSERKEEQNLDKENVQEKMEDKGLAQEEAELDDTLTLSRVTQLSEEDIKKILVVRAPSSEDDAAVAKSAAGAETEMMLPGEPGNQVYEESDEIDAFYQRLNQYTYQSMDQMPEDSQEKSGQLEYIYFYTNTEESEGVTLIIRDSYLIVQDGVAQNSDQIKYYKIEK